MEKTRIKIMSTTDVHGYMNKGLSGLPALKADLEADVLIDNGDFFVGSSFATYGYTQGMESPLVEVANELAYDVMIPGNHDLDYGLNWLKQQVSSLNATYVCANLFDREDQLIFEPYALVERHSIKIAVIGLMTHGLGQLLPEAVVSEVKTASPVSVLRKVLPKVSKIADIIVVAYHGGLTRDPTNGKVWHYPSLEDQAYDLVENFPEIDSLICGHQHFTNTAVNIDFKTAVIQPGSFGQMVGYQVFEVPDKPEPVTLLENRLITLNSGNRYATSIDKSYQAWLESAADIDRLIQYVQGIYQGDIYMLRFKAQTVGELALELNGPFPFCEYWMTGHEVKKVLQDVTLDCQVTLLSQELVDHTQYKLIATPQLIPDDYLRKQFLVPLFSDFMTSL